jgi:cytochrome d ubiquinol oxidase subunit I
MQHPVGYTVVGGRAELNSLWALLTNPYLRWQYPHVISGSMITASMAVAGVGAFYLLSGYLTWMLLNYLNLPLALAIAVTLRFLSKRSNIRYWK